MTKPAEAPKEVEKAPVEEEVKTDKAKKDPPHSGDGEGGGRGPLRLFGFVCLLLVLFFYSYFFVCVLFYIVFMFFPSRVLMCFFLFCWLWFPRGLSSGFPMVLRGLLWFPQVILKILANSLAATKRLRGSVCLLLARLLFHTYYSQNLPNKAPYCTHTVTNFSRSDLSWKRLLGGGEQVRGVVAILSITLGFAIFL